MNESTDLAYCPPKLATQSRWRRHRKLWLTLMAVLTFLLWAFYYYFLADRGLGGAMAEADRLDPGWRFADLEAARPDVPDEENGALVVLKAKALLPNSWPPDVPGLRRELGLAEFEMVQPVVQFDDDQVQQLRALLRPAQAAVHVARRLTDFPRGRYTVAWLPNYPSTAMPYWGAVFYVGMLLTLDSALRAQENDIDGALESSMAELNAGRSIGDETAFSAQLERGYYQGTAVHRIERCLAQGEPGLAVLHRLQQLVDDEAGQPVLLSAARARRAERFAALQTMRARKLDPSFNRSLFGIQNPCGLPDSVMSIVDSATTRGCQTDFLRYWSAYVEIAKLPPKKRMARLKTLQRPLQELPTILDALYRGDDRRPAYRLLGWQADLRCAVAAIAAERHRQAGGSWPNSLTDLVPEFLAKLPEDPFDGEPVRFRKVADGIEIYSIGLSGNRTGWEAPADIHEPAECFRLWNVERRRQPATKQGGLGPK